MFLATIYNIIHWLIRAYIFIIFAEVILSYFMSPFHPVRQFLYRLVEPALGPIRRLMPNLGGFDFSPVLLILGLQILDMLLGNLFLRF